jgi:hypothetical protein
MKCGLNFGHSGWVLWAAGPVLGRDSLILQTSVAIQVMIGDQMLCFEKQCWHWELAGLVRVFNFEQM